VLVGIMLVGIVPVGIAPVGIGTCNAYNFFVSGPKFTNFFTRCGRGCIVDNAVFTFSSCPSVTGIFAIKVECCPKSRRIFHVFALPNFVGDPFQKLYSLFMATSWDVAW